MPADTERLEARVREALGAGVDGYRDGDLAAARDHVLGGVRRLRRQRLQVATGGFAVALALAVTLPLAVSGGPPTPTRQGAAAPTQAPGVRQPATSTTEAACVTGAKELVPCGMLGPTAVFGTAASPASTSPNDAGLSTAVGSAAAHPLVLRVGHEAVVALPGTSSGASWHAPRPVVDPLPHGHPIITIRPTARTGGWRIVAERVGTATVEAERSGCSGGGACPPAASTWTLYVEVTS